MAWRLQDFRAIPRRFRTLKESRAPRISILGDSVLSLPGLVCFCILIPGTSVPGARLFRPLLGLCHSSRMHSAPSPEGTIELSPSGWSAQHGILGRPQIDPVPIGTVEPFQPSLTGLDRGPETTQDCVLRTLSWAKFNRPFGTWRAVHS